MYFYIASEPSVHPSQASVSSGFESIVEHSVVDVGGGMFVVFLCCIPICIVFISLSSYEYSSGGLSAIHRWFGIASDCCRYGFW